MASANSPPQVPNTTARSWIEWLWSSVADRGRSYTGLVPPQPSETLIDRAKGLAAALVSQRGEASGAAVAHELLEDLQLLPQAERLQFFRFVAENFLPDENVLRTAAQAWLADP